MKKLFLLVFFSFLTLAVFSQREMHSADVFLEYQIGDKINPSLNFFTGKTFLKYLMLTSDVSLNIPLTKAVVGLSVKPTSWFMVGAGAGLEVTSLNNKFAARHKDFLPRYEANLFLGGEKLSFFAIIDRGLGVNNYSYKTSVNYQVSENWRLSLMAWRFHGAGLRISSRLKNSASYVLFFPSYDLDSKSFKISLGFSVDISRKAIFEE